MPRMYKILVETSVNVTLFCDAFVRPPAAAAQSVLAPGTVRTRSEGGGGRTAAETAAVVRRVVLNQVLGTEVGLAFQERDMAFQYGWVVCVMCTMLVLTLLLVCKSFEKLIDELSNPCACPPHISHA